MNSLMPVGPQRTESQARTRSAFNWIDLIALPIAASIMETQAFALVLLLLADAAEGENAVPALDATSITLLLLGLQWWAMLIHYLMERGLKDEWARFFHPAGYCLALVITIVTHHNLLQHIPSLVIAAGLIVWFWRRGMKLAPIGASDTYLIIAFKVCFITLLVILVASVLYFSQQYPSDPSFNLLHAAVGSGLVVFFLSGLVCLSLTRLSIIKREDAYHAPGSSLTDPIRLWLVGLTLFWIGITVAALALETFSFGVVTDAVVWLWNGFWGAVGALANLISPLFVGLFRLLSFLFPYFNVPRQSPPSAHPSQPGSASDATPLPMSVIMTIRLVLVLLLLLVLVLVIRAILRRWHVRAKDDNEEEIREALSMQVIWKQRREGQGKRNTRLSPAPALEALSANSARYHYRELLQALAEQEDLARHEEETPEEYKTRLLSMIKRRSPSGVEGPDTEADLLQLEELTEAYARERYGGKPADFPRVANLSRWVPEFVRRLEDRGPGDDARR